VFSLFTYCCLLSYRFLYLLAELLIWG
jgi:hypothetical protein